MTPIYLEPDEILVLLRALAVHATIPPVDPVHGPEPLDATQCSRIVWDSPVASPLQRSLATALAEATYADGRGMEQ